MRTIEYYEIDKEEIDLYWLGKTLIKYAENKQTGKRYMLIHVCVWGYVDKPILIHMDVYVCTYLHWKEKNQKGYWPNSYQEIFQKNGMENW